MELTVSKAKRIFDDDGWWICFQAPERDVLKILEGWKQGVKHIISVALWRNKRSNDANAYCWTILNEMAHKNGSTKEEIYREIIRKKTIRAKIVPILENEVDSWISDWESAGLGWVCEDLGRSKITGYRNIICNSGSSRFDTRQMSVFLDEVVFEAQELGIETMTPDELARLKAIWKENDHA